MILKPGIVSNKPRIADPNDNYLQTWVFRFIVNWHMQFSMKVSFKVVSYV